MTPEVPSSPPLDTPPGWRLILDDKRGAADNMAIDEAILRACAQAIVPPTIRIYSWQRPSISLGSLQAVTPEEIDLQYCRANGIQVVRRITGGRAVIHGSDVTFSIALRQSDIPHGCSSVIATHRWLMAGIVSGLRLLGFQAELGGEFRDPHPAFRNPTADCFAHIAECDVRIGRAKAVGAAQTRRFGAVLEQGSIPYAAPGFEVARVFPEAPPVADTGPLYGSSFAQIAEAVTRGLQHHLATPLQPAELTSHEIETARELARRVYAADQWTILSEPANGPTTPAGDS
jgi:lipoate-protein ligase A